MTSITFERPDGLRAITTYRRPKQQLPFRMKLLGGAFAGVVGTSCVYPLDVVKTRMQASKGPMPGPFSVFRFIIKNEGGKRALYRGLSANLIGVTPEKAIKLAVNDYIREWLQPADGSPLSIAREVIAGAGAGFCQVIATNPMEVTKIRMQMQAATLPLAERLNVVEMVQELGVRGLYVGTTATMTRDVGFSIVFFPLYAQLKAALADEKGENSMSSVLQAGMLAGSLGAAAVTPADVIKTRMQVEGGFERFGGCMRNAASAVWKQEGPGAFFRGMLPRIMVMGPLFSITLLVFEAQKKFLCRNNNGVER